MEKWTDRTGRALLAILFIAGAVQKIADPEATQALLVMRGLPIWLIWPALAFNALGAICLLTGRALAPIGLALAAYCLLTSAFHWIPDDPWQMSIVVKNCAIAGGLLIVAARAMERPPREITKFL